MGTVRARFKANRLNPVSYKPSVLPRRDVDWIVEPARPEVLFTDHPWIGQPTFQRLPRSFRQFETNRLLCLALQDRRSFFDLAGCVHIGDLQAHEITAPQFAIYRRVEQREIPMVLGDFEAHADRPYMLWEQWAFLAHDAALVPSGLARDDCG